MTSSWPTKKIGEVITINYGKGLPRQERSPDGKYPVYGANGILDMSDRFLVDKEAIIIGRKGSVGELTRVSGKFWPSDVTYYVLGNHLIDITYLYFGLKNLHLQQFAIGVKPGLNRNQVYNLEIHLPPIFEQKKIVTKLENQLSKIAEVLQLRTEAQEDVRKLLSAEIHQILENGKRLGWSEVELSEITERAVQINPSDIYRTTFPYIDISGINNELAEINRIKVSDAPSRARKLIKEGDTIFATTRPYLRKIAFITPDLDASIVSTGFCVLRPNPKRVLPEFLYLIVSANFFVEEVASFQRGATYPAVSDTVIYSRIVPIPDLHEQKNIISKMLLLKSKLKQIQNHQVSTEEMIKSLELEILHKAYLTQ